MSRAFSRYAAAFLAAALFLFAVACSDNGDSEPLTASPSETSVPSPTATSPDSTQEPDSGFVLGNAVDLADNIAAMTIYGKDESDLLSGSVNIALGDFNGDGEPDVLIGAPTADGLNGVRPGSGEAYVIFGPLEGTLDLSTDDADITIVGAEDGDSLGFTVFAGDLNDDGADDILVGAQNPSIPFPGLDARTQQGRLYILYGGSDLDDSGVFDLADNEFDASVTGAEGFSHLSTSIALGDLNGDGDLDLLVSAPFAGRELGSGPGGMRTTVGEVYAIFGSDDGPRGEYNIQLGDYDVLFSGDDENGQFGSSIAVGDFNGDGVDDLLAGAHLSADPDARAGNGAAYIFYGDDDISGRVSIADGEQSVSILGPASSAAFGSPVAAGDVNGDGTDDIVIGARREGTVGGNLGTSGALRVFFGGDLPDVIDLQADTADLTVPGSSSGPLLPTAVAVGNLDQDDSEDIVFTSMLSGTTRGRGSAGLVYTLVGSGSIPATIDIDSDVLPPPIIGPATEARLGTAAFIGEIADGVIGLAVIASGAGPNNDGSGVGAVFVIRLDQQ